MYQSNLKGYCDTDTVQIALKSEIILNINTKHQFQFDLFFSLNIFSNLCSVILPKQALLTDIFREAYFAILPICVKLGHFRKMVYWSVVRICLYLACIRIKDEIRTGEAYSPFSINQRSPSRHTEGEGAIKPHFSFYAP